MAEFIVEVADEVVDEIATSIKAPGDEERVREYLQSQVNAIADQFASNIKRRVLREAGVSEKVADVGLDVEQEALLINHGMSKKAALAEEARLLAEGK